MGYFSGTSEDVRHEPSNLFLYNCRFQSGVLKVSASAVAKDGYVLERDADGKLKVASTITAGRAYFVLASRDELYGEREFAVRVCVCGTVKKSLVTKGGSALTLAEADALRSCGILPVEVTSIGYDGSESDGEFVPEVESDDVELVSNEDDYVVLESRGQYAELINEEEIVWQL